jgi:hypothetical protein
MANRGSDLTQKYVTIFEPTADPENLRQTVAQLKEIVEVLIRQRRPIDHAAVTWQDLVDLELIVPDQKPRR